MATRSRFFRRKCWTSSCSRSWKPTAQNNFARNAFHFARFLLYLLVRPVNRAMGASSSVGQSWRLITAWSRVQVLDGPPQSTKVSAFVLLFLLIRTVPCSSGCESHHAAYRRPACRSQGSCWAARVRLLLACIYQLFSGFPLSVI